MFRWADYFSIDIEDASFLAWQNGELDMMHWSIEHGLDRVRRPIAVLDEPIE